GDRLLPRAPRRPDQMMVEHGDPERPVRCLEQTLMRTLELAVADPARLMAPWPDRVESDHVQVWGRERRFRRLPLALELAKGVREAGREGVRDVVVAGDRKDRPVEAVQKPRGADELILSSAVAQIAARDH